MERKKRIKWTVRVLAAILLTVWLVLGNSLPGTTEYTVSGKLPQSFSGFRIAQVSDLHNTSFGENNSRLLTLLENAQPDIIVITGDMIDSRRTDIPTALNFAEQAVKIAPCYYVTGNHESRIRRFSELEEGLRLLGVRVLRNEAVTLEREGQVIRLIGMDDCTFFPGKNGNQTVLAMEAALQKLTGPEYTVLLSHRPELFWIYRRNDVDLILSGHAHGGQFRIPFVGGLYAPDQGMFPEYDCGAYSNGGVTMVVSRGLGNSAFPLRINNPPELVVVTLTVQTE